MIVSREAVFAALFARVSVATFLPLHGGATAFKTVSRRIKLWSDVPPQGQPALFQTEHHETTAWQAENSPGKTTLNVDLFVYIDARDKHCIPATDLNLVLDGLGATLAPDPGTNRQTLGGLVSHCRVEGQVLKDPGDLDGQGLAIVPIRILVP